MVYYAGVAYQNTIFILRKNSNIRVQSDIVFERHLKMFKTTPKRTETDILMELELIIRTTTSEEWEKGGLSSGERERVDMRCFIE